METRIYIAELSDGTLNVFYTQPRVTGQDITKFVDKVTDYKVNDIYEEKQSNLQYYCIDGRVWIDTDEKVNRMYQRINN
jgi:TusA-related sulfurtransferase